MAVRSRLALVTLPLLGQTYYSTAPDVVIKLDINDTQVTLHDTLVTREATSPSCIAHLRAAILIVIRPTVLTKQALAPKTNVIALLRRKLF